MIRWRVWKKEQASSQQQDLHAHGRCHLDLSLKAQARQSSSIGLLEALESDISVRFANTWFVRPNSLQNLKEGKCWYLTHRTKSDKDVEFKNLGQICASPHCGRWSMRWEQGFNKLLPQTLPNSSEVCQTHETSSTQLRFVKSLVEQFQSRAPQFNCQPKFWSTYKLCSSSVLACEDRFEKHTRNRQQICELIHKG